MSAVQGISWDDHKSRTITRSITWNDKKGRRTAVAVLAGFAAMLVVSTFNVALHHSSHLVSVIVRAQGGQLDAAAQLVEGAGGTVVRRVGLIDGMVASVPADAVAALTASPSVAEVTSDAHLQLLGTTYDPTSDVDSLHNIEAMDGALAYWQAGYTGQGVDVALIDSGVAPVDGLTGYGKVVNGPDLSAESQDPSLQYVDTFGHGTHMAGIIAGHDSAATSVSATDTEHFLGMAPDARIVSVKVADASGQTDVAHVIAAIDWVVQHRTDNGLNIRVLNLSFGTPSTDSYQYDPLAYAAEQAWKHGICVVVAAGNGGNTSSSLNDPAIDPYLIAVGAADTNDTTKVSSHTAAAFTSSGDGTRNPDLAAPGVHIASLRVPGSSIDQQFGDTAAVGTRFFRGSGTSQAAAIVSGAAALIISQRPSITPDELKALLVKHTHHMKGSTNLTGAGELDLGSMRRASTPDATQSWSPARSTGRDSNHDGTSGGDSGGDHSSENGESRGDRPTRGDASNRDSSTGSWSSGSWSSGTWSGDSWSDGTWSSGTWSSGRWSSVTWSSGTWSSGSWSSGSWSSGSWSSAFWSARYWS